MNKLLDKLKDNEQLSDKYLNNIYQEIIQHFISKLHFDDSIMGSISLINNQKQLIEIAQYIKKDEILSKNIAIQLVIELIIREYDYQIIHQFNKFSRVEKLKIIYKFYAEELVDDFLELKSLYDNYHIDVLFNVDIDKLPYEFRLLKNLKYIEYDGTYIKSYTKSKSL